MLDDDSTEEFADDDATAPRRLIVARYRLGELLGRGGMASVYRAVDESLGRTVAVKIFHAGLAHAQDARRQREETILLASLNHPNLVTLFDAASDGDDGFLVMEFVDGNDLRTRMQAGVLDSRSTALIGADIASALSYIHGRGVTHRDVKPGNILLTSQAGESNPVYAKLADFGIARLIDSTHLTSTGSLVGTASFLSPEQAQGAHIGSPSDVYSLALTLLECLTGERAFPGTAVESAIARIHRDPPIPPHLGPAWLSVLRTATARDASLRGTAAELATSLRALADDDVTLVLPVAARDRTLDEEHTRPMTSASALTEALEPQPSGPIPPRARVRDARRKLIVGSVIAVIVVGFSVVGLWSARPGQSTDAATDQGSSGTTGEIIYPSVEGDLGLHLTQLQESVTP